MSEYSKGVSSEGFVVLKDGKPMSIADIIIELRARTPTPDGEQAADAISKLHALMEVIGAMFGEVARNGSMCGFNAAIAMSKLIDIEDALEQAAVPDKASVDAVSVPRDLLEKIVEVLDSHNYCDTPNKLRALLAAGSDA